jgi:hypothetical protein
MAVIDKIKTQNAKTSALANTSKDAALGLRSIKKSLDSTCAMQENDSVEINLSEKDWSTFTNALTSRRTTPKLNQAFKKLKKQCD